MKTAKQAFPSRGGSPRHLLLPQTIINVLQTLIDELPNMPDPKRVFLRDAIFAIRRAYRMPVLANPVDLEWESDETTDVSPDGDP